MKTTTYLPARLGLATEFSESGQPPEYARRLVNRFININGEPETRPGLRLHSQFFGDDVDTFIDPDTRLTLLAEHVTKSGESILLNAITHQILGSFNYDSETWAIVSRYDMDTQSWIALDNDQGFPGEEEKITLGYTSDGTTVFQQGKPYAAQDGDKTIIVAPNLQPSYFDPMKNKMYPMSSILESGKAGAGTTTVKLFDAEISNWLAQTLVRTNDVVYNVTRQAYAIITSVGATELSITPIRAGSGDGLGNGIYGTGTSQAVGDFYQIWDLVENNVVPTNLNDFDNVDDAGVGSSPEVIVVSGWSPINNGVLPGDFIYNTTRNVVVRVSEIFDTDLQIDRNFSISVSGQMANDSLIFLKSPVPIATYPHVHYGRLYLIDYRDQTKVRISAPDDPLDFTTFNLTLDASTLNYGAKQPHGEQLLTLGTFQRYLVAGGTRSVYMDEGINPIADVSGDSTNVAPVGLFTQGVVCVKGLANIGSNMVFGSIDGMRQFNVTDILAVDTDNISEAIKTELRNAINSQLSLSRDDIQVIHYPTRNWVMFKVGTTIYNFNYTALFQQGQLIRGGSWSKFTGTLADCQEFLLRSDGVLMCAQLVSGDTSYYNIYEFDTGSYDDNGESIMTDYETSWLGPGNGQVMENKYIKPYFETLAPKTYQFTISADLKQEYIDDTITVTADTVVSGNAVVGMAIVGQAVVGGQKATSTNKYGLRANGEEIKVRIQTTSGQGGDKIGKFVLYGDVLGIR